MDISDDKRDDSRNMAVGYEELCKTYNAIRDFRAKLLGFLPLASGGGIFLLLEKSESGYLIPIGLIGALVTLGLWFYEKHNMNRCHNLIKRGAEWETSLTGNGGQFQDHPLKKEPDKMSLVIVAARFVYGSVFAGWLFVVYVGVRQYVC